MMSASPPLHPNRLLDSLTALEVCQDDPFGAEFKQVDVDLMRKLDTFIGQCLDYVKLPSKAAKAFKCYDTDKGRFVGLSARARQQKSNGCLELSLREQITILFIMALYRTDKEGSSESVADPVESCSGNDRGEYDSPHINTPDYIMNRHGGTNTENLLGKIQDKISLIKDNLNKYFAREYDYDKQVYAYKNCLLKAEIDYTNDVEFVKLISQMSTKTKTVSDAKCPQVKPKSRPMPAKRRTTISHVTNRMSAPHLAGAEQPMIREAFTETVNPSTVDYTPYQQYSTPSYVPDYQMNLGQPAETAPMGNFLQFTALDQADQNILNVAVQGVPGAFALFKAAPNSHQLYCCLTKLHELFEKATGQRYLDLLNGQQQQQQLASQAMLAYSTLSNSNGPMNQPQEMDLVPQVAADQPQFLDVFQQLGFGELSYGPQQSSSG